MKPNTATPMETSYEHQRFDALAVGPSGLRLGRGNPVGRGPHGQRNGTAAGGLGCQPHRQELTSKTQKTSNLFCINRCFL